MHELGSERCPTRGVSLVSVLIKVCLANRVVDGREKTARPSRRFIIVNWTKQNEIRNVWLYVKPQLEILNKTNSLKYIRHILKLKTMFLLPHLSNPFSHKTTRTSRWIAISWWNLTPLNAWLNASNGGRKTVGIKLRDLKGCEAPSVPSLNYRPKPFIHTWPHALGRQDLLSAAGLLLGSRTPHKASYWANWFYIAES